MSNLLSKSKIVEACQDYIATRKDNALQAIKAVQASGEEETKSSAGDKFETSREMMKQELQRHQELLNQAMQMEQVLSVLPLEARAVVGPGSLIHTDQGLIFMAIGIGKLKVAGEDVVIISPAAPIAKLCLGKKSGEQFSFNGKTYQIAAVE